MIGWMWAKGAGHTCSMFMMGAFLRIRSSVNTMTFPLYFKYSSSRPWSHNLVARLLTRGHVSH